MNSTHNPAERLTAGDLEKAVETAKAWAIKTATFAVKYPHSIDEDDLATAEAVTTILTALSAQAAELAKAGEALAKISEGGPDIGPISRQTYSNGFDQGCAWAGRVARDALGADQ